MLWPPYYVTHGAFATFWPTDEVELILCEAVRLSVRPSVTHAHCGKMAGWIEMKLGMRVGIAPCSFVLDGAPSPGEGG